MSRSARTQLLLFAAAVAGGAGLHFLYTLLPCPLTALVAPVNESLWEHVKLLYWPCLISGLLLERRFPGKLGQRAFALLAAAAGMLAIGYIYHILLRGDSLLFDLLLYGAMMALFFLLPRRLDQPCWLRWQDVLALLVLALGSATFLFTFLPPGGLLFTDLSGAPSWATIPC